MKFKSVMLLGVAVACGLIAMLGVQQVMSSPSESNEEPENTQVLIATADIEPYAPLDESNTAFKTMPLKDVPAGAILTREECLERTLRYGVVENDLILNSKLTEKNHKPSSEIPKGMRLVTVKVNQTKTHSGLIRPGDHVDVILTYKYRENNKQPMQTSLVILQNVKVFATDNRRRVNEKEGGDVNAKNMSLVVFPDDGNLLILAESKGQLTMALRTKDEPIVENPKPINEQIFHDLLARKDSGAQPQDEEEDNGKPSFQPKFDEFLKGNPTQGPLAENKDGQPVLASANTWKITIFNGSEATVEEVSLPGEDGTTTPHGQSAIPTPSASKKTTRIPAARKATSTRRAAKKPPRSKKSKPAKPAAI